MRLESVKQHWERLAAADPFWAILTRPDKAHRGWDPEEFFRSGQPEVDHAMAQIAGLGVHPARGYALDFGCGAGRLTRALAKHFDRVRGIDISERMIALANRYNAFPERCRFTVNSANSLAGVETASCDLVLSLITLQHIPPAFTRGYFDEFLRVLKPGGALVFQLPAEPVDKRLPARLARAGYLLLYGKLLKRPVIYMYAIPRAEVVAHFESRGAKVVAVLPDGSPGPKWVSYRYVIVKPE